MRPYTTKTEVRAQARQEAQRALEQLEIDQSQPIDIFRIIQDENIWLMFQPLEGLYGAYIPRPDAPGIIIQSKHPLSTQRFTAGHEFGHHVLKHSLSLDDEGMIRRAQSSNDVREVAADTFAAYFLMPLQLVNTVLRRRNLPPKPGQLTDLQVYQLSLDMGVSYLAAVNHLATIGVIRRDTADALRPVRPKSIKAQVGGTPLENSWADIWILGKEDAGRRLRLRVFDELSICLPESPTTGYVWMPDDIISDRRQPDRQTPIPASSQPSLFMEYAEQNTWLTASAPLELLSSSFEANASNGIVYGASGNRYLTIRSLLPGQYTLRLQKRRPWQAPSTSVETFEVNIDVAAKQVGLSAEQQLRLAA